MFPLIESKVLWNTFIIFGGLHVERVNGTLWSNLKCASHLVTPALLLKKNRKPRYYKTRFMIFACNFCYLSCHQLNSNLLFKKTTPKLYLGDLISCNQSCTVCLSFQNHPQGIMKRNFTINLHCWSQLKNVDSSGIWTRTFGLRFTNLFSFAIIKNSYRNTTVTPLEDVMNNVSV